MAKTKATISIPEIQEFLKAGVQFGHQAKKWNPKMGEYIYEKRGSIHIIDLSKTIPMLEKAAKFLAEASAEGKVLFVGTKRQASEIVKEAAIEAGAYYITHRWPGGLLTNFDLIKKSLKKFRSLEEEFEKGVEGRTKFEVSQMKKEWLKMNRLYEGVKTMDKFPKAIVLVDSKYERGAVREANKLGIPLIALIDTNSDPSVADYPIPANDDAIKSVKLFMDLFAEAVKLGNNGKGVVHNYKDYTKFDVEIKKSEVVEDAVVEVESSEDKKAKKPAPMRVSQKKSKKSKGKGALEKIQKDAESKKIEKAKKSRK